ncbi:5-azacytidine-induced protein 2 isoform X3 [Antechinus flavipes]|uniref:5-azacytidine-induced protein 2 isoform X3 n=1 Tax=Antechinus flavipes TaxID=38775 RepID=UPI002236B4F7|nr:5-azacytidine-induced protein 2 isoform X3 [Antechinus flavipes]
MDALVEDDICILNHEKSQRRDTITPLSIYTGDESMASHFALVTAYEDIKKRLKDSEKENSLLKKRIRFLEEKNKDNSESLKVLNEQLQTKEVELLQLRTEVETQQVMRNLNRPSSNWEVEKLSSDLRIHGLEQQLELMRKECTDLRTELQKFKSKDLSQEDNLNNTDFQRPSIQSDNMQHAYWELKREMSNLHLVTQVQAELLRKLKTSSIIKKGSREVFPSTEHAARSGSRACAPVQCMDDLVKDCTNLHLGSLTATYKRHTPLSPNGKAFCSAMASPLSAQSWAENERVSPGGATNFQEQNSYGRNSLEDNSWVFPSPPKSSETAFGESKSKTPSPNLPHLDQHNPNCLYKN